MHEFIVLPIPALQSGRVRDARYAYPVQPISLQDPGEPSPLPIGSFTTLFPPFSSRYHRSSRSLSFELDPRTDSPGHTDPPIPCFDRLVSSPGDALLHRVTNGSGEEDVCSSAFVSCTPHTRLGRCACRISPCFSLQHVCPPLRVLPTGVSVSKRRCFA